MCSVSKNCICCLLLSALCFAGAKRVYGQLTQSYTLKSSEAASTPEPFRISFSASSRAVTFSFPLGGPQSFNIRAEYFRSASMPRLFERTLDVKADWKFRSIPITASYTYELPSPTSRIVPVVGVGVSAHLYRETRLVDSSTGLPFNYVQSAPLLLSNSTSMDKVGMILGAEVSLGLRTQLGQHLFIMTEGRYRYVNCSVEALGRYSHTPLNVLDFNVSVGFSL